MRARRPRRPFGLVIALFALLALGAAACEETPMDMWIAIDAQAGADYVAPVREAGVGGEAGIDAGTDAGTGTVDVGVPDNDAGTGGNDTGTGGNDTGAGGDDAGTDADDDAAGGP